MSASAIVESEPEQLGSPAMAVRMLPRPDDLVATIPKASRQRTRASVQRPITSNTGGSDLQYVTQRVDGALFGGWYRVLDLGRLELLALGSVWQAPRNAAPPQRQARAMLAKLARMRQRPATSRSQITGATLTATLDPTNNQPD